MSDEFDGPNGHMFNFPDLVAARAAAKKARRSPKAAPSPNGGNGQPTAPRPAPAQRTSAETHAAKAPSPAAGQGERPRAAAPVRDAGSQQTARPPRARRGGGSEPRARPAPNQPGGADGAAANGDVPVDAGPGVPSPNGRRGAAAGPPGGGGDQHTGRPLRPGGG